MAETCPLCGGELEEEEIEVEREDKIRSNNPDLEEEGIHAKVCKKCGHVSYHRDQE